MDTTLTRMLIGTSCVFVACTTPLFLFYVALPFVPELTLNGKYHTTYKLIIALHQMLVYGNSSVNFFVYLSLGPHFASQCGARYADGGQPFIMPGGRADQRSALTQRFLLPNNNRRSVSMQKDVDRRRRTLLMLVPLCVLAPSRKLPAQRGVYVPCIYTRVR